ncbi:hypothetical protein [Haliangium sp. UPWRP_2]|uniref:hypothetical protein n=1 Tax=Haliangium sp. UPWRP_2 TaxID=1931276 RepID=UPI000D0DA675|nr:hypothetical protein [Haliangium sp. UPWRP_2]PSM30557.1 hypothetical protein BVG81_009910 [Haliangium sp. UPWRP_2]
MSQQSSIARRPDFVPEDWLRCTRGFSFTSPPPAELRADRHLESANPWEQLLCVTLQAQAGDFRHADRLVRLAMSESDSHLRDSAITVFGLCAPSIQLTRMGDVFHHPDYDTRLEAYAAACLTGSLAVAELLAEQRTQVRGYERERVMDHLNSMLEPEDSEPVLIDSPLPDAAFVATVREMTQALRKLYGDQPAIFHGEPLTVEKLAAAIASLCAQDEPEQYGGIIAQLLSLIEAMTGVPYAGCLDDDCDPVLPAISHTLNSLRQSGLLAGLQPGRRYFFGHLIP